ncbi:hypothetical protein L3X38_027426 [Prunus dulcis]|uniref:Uncharacterized protein n=1 Tax=Prunus dulcis TaxID=3755 RepID=A0AAD4Z0B8_PRUDU|nr:hypothetical protein L3X38_027426 [Prunus dulcis]
MSVLKLDHMLYFGFNIFDGVCFAVMELLNQVIIESGSLSLSVATPALSLSFATASSNLDQVKDNFYRPDLKKAALARLSVGHRILKVSKSGVKKRNRQVLKTPVRK